MSTPRKVVHLLDFPVEHGGKEIKEITIRRPKGRDMRLLPGSESPSVEDMYPFFASLLSAGSDQLTEEFVEEMDAADINRVGEIIAGFSKPGGKKATLARLRPVK